ASSRTDLAPEVGELGGRRGGRPGPGHRRPGDVPPRQAHPPRPHHRAGARGRGGDARSGGGVQRDVLPQLPVVPVLLLRHRADPGAALLAGTDRPVLSVVRPVRAHGHRHAVPGRL
ncbi:MAG: hypothetical protein AVDCRST_MAG36-2530, partial [uncultured Nocardioidaceae bacterium]